MSRLAIARFVVLSCALLLSATNGADAAGFSFVVFGDNQFATNSPTSGVPERMAVPYDHFFVPDDDTPTRRDPPPKAYPHNGSGIHYIVTGGGGGPLNRGGWRKGRSYEFFQKRICAYHVTEVKVNAERIHVAVHLVKGSAETVQREAFDTFSLEPCP